MRLSVADLRLVSSVAEHGNLTRAAQVLHISQSALSHRLKSLETRAGAPLFLRMGRRMVTTPAGAKLAESARNILTEIGRAGDEVRRVAQGKGMLLRVSTECYTCYHWLPAALRALSREAPDVEIQIVTSATRRPIPALLSGELDLAIVSDDVNDARIRTEPLFEAEHVALMTPSHRLRSRPYLEPADFADETLVAYVADPADNTLIKEVLSPAGVMPRRVMEVQVTEAIIELVKSGVGIAAMSSWAAEPHVAAGTLCSKRITANGLKRQWRAAVLAYRSAPAHIREIARLLSRTMNPDGAAIPCPPVTVQLPNMKTVA
jgi:LysR family transcriptional regulator for metE and metH